jgi:hypothetical protein
VLNAPDARALAFFYRDLFGWPLADDTLDWCTIRVPGAPANLAFQTEDLYERPTWPATSGKQQMMLHLDIGVSDLGAAVEDAVELGAALRCPIINLKTTCASYSIPPVTRSASTSTAIRRQSLPRAHRCMTHGGHRLDRRQTRTLWRGLVDDDPAFSAGRRSGRLIERGASGNGGDGRDDRFPTAHRAGLHR